MGNDGPVVGLDAPTAESIVIKLVIYFAMTGHAVLDTHDESSLKST